MSFDLEHNTLAIGCGFFLGFSMREAQNVLVLTFSWDGHFALHIEFPLVDYKNDSLAFSYGKFREKKSFGGLTKYSAMSHSKVINLINRQGSID